MQAVCLFILGRFYANEGSPCSVLSGKFGKMILRRLRKAYKKAALGDLILKIEHVGSTSVQGLSAKPIIDIDLVIAIDTDLSEVIQELAVIGYVHEGNLGIEVKLLLTQAKSIFKFIIFMFVLKIRLN